MKKRMILIVFAILLLSSTGFCEFRFDGMGAGGQLGLVVPERDYFGSDGPALGFGFHVLGKFALGSYGDLQYIPSITKKFKNHKMGSLPIIRYHHLDTQILQNQCKRQI